MNDISRCLWHYRKIISWSVTIEPRVHAFCLWKPAPTFRMNEINSIVPFLHLSSSGMPFGMPGFTTSGSKGYRGLSVAAVLVEPTYITMTVKDTPVSF